MSKNLAFIFLASLALTASAKAQFTDPRTEISQEAQQLILDAQELSNVTYAFYRGYNNSINAEEQAILFQAEAFSSAAGLFSKLTNDSNWYAGNYLQTNLNGAFAYLNRSFTELRQTILTASTRFDWRNRWRDGRVSPLDPLDRIEFRLRFIDRLFSRWPSNQNDAYLAQVKRYVRNPRTQAVYMIDKVGTGQYVKRPFTSLESFFAFHQRFRGRITPLASPWDNSVTIGWDQLSSLPDGQPLSFHYEPGDFVVASVNFPAPSGGVFRVESAGRAVGTSLEEISARLGCTFGDSRRERKPYCWDQIFRVAPETITELTAQ